ncbi:MAG: tetratricopeptide repeat protein [Candidatus Thorarchaeota archaeon]
MANRRSIGSINESTGDTPSEDSFEGWFELACQLASSSRLNEAERAMVVALEIHDNYPKAWAILSAIYLALGKETDAERAGKKAIAQCIELKTTWPRFRSVILSSGIKKGKDWRSPRRVLLDEEATSAWGDMLVVLGKSVTDEVEESVQQEEVETIGEHDEIDHEEAVEEIPEETHVEKAITPSISSKKVEGLTKFEIELLRPKSEVMDQKIEEAKTEPKKEALPTFSSKKVVDVTKKYDEQPAPKVIMPKEIAAEAPKSSSSWLTAAEESSSSWFTAAEAQLKKGNLEEAERAYARGLAIDPENSEAWTRIGSLRLNKGNLKDAEDALRVATKHSHRNTNAWYLLGVCLQKQDKWDEALIALRTASNLDQNREDIWFRLGESEFNIGHYQDAARSFLRTLRISSDHKEAMFYLAMCMERRGNRQHALSLFIKLFNTGDLPSDMLERMAGAFERLNRPAEAREARRRAALARKLGS